ncbi:MAG: hypothetical protein GY719_07425 [bacterium]|nr:hypothetical protein [bacterium]
MSQVHNDSGDEMEYLVEDGEGISYGDGLSGRLRPGEVKKLVISSTRFAISFFRPGRIDQVVLREEQVPQDSSLRFHMTEDTPCLEIK